MAEALSVQACIDRHTAYPYDVGTRLASPGQRDRLAAMFAPVREGESVLDVGCNSGYVVDFVPASCVCHGVDVATALVESARRRLASAQVASAEQLPFADRAIDVVALGEILEHVFDPVAVLRESARVARRLVVGTTPHQLSVWGPNGRKRPAAHRFHVRCFTEADLIATIEAAGLASPQITVTDAMGVPQFWCFAAAVRP